MIKNCFFSRCFSSLAIFIFYSLIYCYFDLMSSFKIFFFMIIFVSGLEMLLMMKVFNLLLFSSFSLFLIVLFFKQSLFLHSMFLIALMLSLYSFYNVKKSINYFLCFSFTILYIFLISKGFLHIIESKNPQKVRVLSFVISTTKFADVCAYLFGNFMKYKIYLNHDISPTKTWNGLIAAVIGSFIFGFIFHLFYPIKLPFIYISIFLIGILSQVGDLFESVIKRYLSFSNSGFMPGLGGFLDVIDSLFLVMPFVAIWMD